MTARVAMIVVWSALALGLAGQAEAAPPGVVSPAAVGTYKQGALVGGVQLPLEGAHHYALFPARCYSTPQLAPHYPDPTRTRNIWGHPDTVAAIEAVAQAVRARHATAPRLAVGELSHRDGGPVPFHLSHQNGLDVDISYLQAAARGGGDARHPVPRCGLGRRYERTNPTTGRWEVDPDFELAWNWALAAELAARDDVKVIFVGTLIETALGEWARANKVPRAERRRTMRKLHPVRCRAPKGLAVGSYRNNYCPHDDHFHVRFKCPRGDRRCRTK